MDEIEKTWTKTSDGIYEAIHPENFTISRLVSDMASVIRDMKTNNEQNKSIRVIIDGSNVKTIEEGLLTAFISSVRDRKDDRAAYYNESKEYKEILDKFYSNNAVPENIRRFNTKEEALVWIRS